MINDLFIFKASYLDVDIHSHNAIQIVIGLDNVFNSFIDGENVTNTAGFIIDSNRPHACKTSHCIVLVINVNPQSPTGRRLKLYFSGDKSFYLLNDIVSTNTITSFIESYNDNKSEVERFIELLFPATSSPVSYDERVMETIRYIEKNAANNRMNLTDIAAHIFLSAERFRHLFKEQTGTSVSHYILWTKMRVALYQVIERNEILMSAAAYAGFSDAAHLSRTFRSMFGISMTAFLKNSRFIQVEQLKAI